MNEEETTTTLATPTTSDDAVEAAAEVKVGTVVERISVDNTTSRVMIHICYSDGPHLECYLAPHRDADVVDLLVLKSTVPDALPRVLLAAGLEPDAVAAQVSFSSRLGRHLTFVDRAQTAKAVAALVARGADLAVAAAEKELQAFKARVEGAQTRAQHIVASLTDKQPETIGLN